MKSFISRSIGSQLNLFDNPRNDSRIETPIEQGVDCHTLFIPNDSTPTNGLSQEHLNLPESFFIPQSNNESWSQSPSVTFSYAQEWYRLFELGRSESNGSDDSWSSRLQQYAIAGRLRNSRFRSICWRIFLGVLSADSAKWISELNSQRHHFASINRIWNKNPGEQMSDDHPLASDISSSWNQYFRSMQIKRLIAQDVERTFPNVEYFRKTQVREIMINILYCYSVHAEIPYRQGMHEILAPLLFVLHCDLTAFAHAQESGLVPPDLLDKLSIILDTQYFEADSFTMFAKIMDQIHQWYHPYPERSKSTDHLDLEPINNSICPNSTLCNGSEDPVLFNLPSEDSQCPGVSFAESIHKNLLSKYDYDLYLHLKRLEIAPAFFGVRWIRLLFGYEFPLQDLIYIWDCIFAVDDHYSFVPFMYVSMLLFLSPSLMKSGYSECLSLLMRFPTGVDVTHLIFAALHLYKPSVYPAPLCSPNQQPQSSAQIKISKSRHHKNSSNSPKNLPLVESNHMRTRSLSRKMSMTTEILRKNRIISGSTNTIHRTSFLKEIFNPGKKSLSADDSSPVTEQSARKDLLARKPDSHLTIPNNPTCDTDRTTVPIENVKHLLNTMRTLMKVCINSLQECSNTLSLMVNEPTNSSFPIPFETSTDSANFSSLQLQLVKFVQNKLKFTQNSMLDFVHDDFYEFENQLSNQTDYEPDQSLLELADNLMTMVEEEKSLNSPTWNMIQNDADILGPPGAMLPMGPIP